MQSRWGNARRRKEKAMSGWLKAGLIGAVILMVLKVVEVVPCVICCGLPLEWVLFGCIGALAAYWLPPGARTMGSGAGQGALAGLIAAAIGGVIGIGVNVVGATVLQPLQESVLRTLPPEVWGGMIDAGIDPSMLTGTGADVVGTIGTSSVCCGIGLVVAAALGALGGLIFAAVKSE
jgi:hypothetical protein